MVLVDVMVLACLYTIRILARSAAAGVMVSPWLAAFSIFFFLSLAFVKRFSELESMSLGSEATGRSRSRAGATASPTSNNCAASARPADTHRLWSSRCISAPWSRRASIRTTRACGCWSVLLAWLSRLWLKASRGELEEDPVVYAITDRRSLQLGVVVVAIVLSAL